MCRICRYIDPGPSFVFIGPPPTRPVAAGRRLARPPLPAIRDLDRAHGSLEGVGGLKTNEAYHSKADALVIPEMWFFENLPTPFFGNVGFVKFGTFSALLALPVMIREEYGQIAHQTLPYQHGSLSPTGARKVDLVAIPGQCRLSTAPSIWPLSLDLRTNGSS